MIFISAIANWWLGLCRKTPKVYALPTGMINSPDPAYEGSPDGGAGGSGTIWRGLGSAHSGMKTLIHNPQLLWFSLLAGLVLVGHIIAQGLLVCLFYSYEWRHFFHPIGVLWRSFVDPLYTNLLIYYTVTFAVELSMVFCLVFLLACLIMSLSSKNGGPVSLVQGLLMTRKYSRPLEGYSLIVALTGTLLFFAFQYFSLRIWDFLINVMSLYPYYLKDSFARDVMFWGTEAAYGDILIISVINVFLFVLTLFVVPLIVIERTNLKEAVSGSFALLKKIRGEVASCVLGLGIIVFAAFLPYLLAGVVFEQGGYTINPGDAWLAAVGILYVLAIFSLAFIAATVGGITALGFYTSAKKRELDDESAKTVGNVI